jgi:hypothetical protein
MEAELIRNVAALGAPTQGLPNPLRAARSGAPERFMEPDLRIAVDGFIHSEYTHSVTQFLALA